MDLVSIIIPNYNHADFLDLRISSVLNQTYTHIEVIILDDCSTDNSIEIINRYKNHPKITSVLVNSTNSNNIIDQWRKGVKHARGKYVWIAESDDYAHPDFLSEQLDILTGKENIGIACSNSFIIDENNSIIGSTEVWKNNYFKTTRWNKSFTNIGKTELYDYLIDVCTINNISSCVFNKPILSKVLNSNIKLKVTADWLVYMKILLISDISYNSNKLNYYREHSKNTSKKYVFNGGYVADKFMAKLYFYKDVVIPFKEKKLVFSALIREYRGLLHLLIHNKINLIQILSINLEIRNPLLILLININALIKSILNSD